MCNSATIAMRLGCLLLIALLSDAIISVSEAVKCEADGQDNDSDLAKLTGSLYPDLTSCQELASAGGCNVIHKSILELLCPRACSLCEEICEDQVALNDLGLPFNNCEMALYFGFCDTIPEEVISNVCPISCELGCGAPKEECICGTIIERIAPRECSADPTPFPTRSPSLAPTSRPTETPSKAPTAPPSDAKTGNLGRIAADFGNFGFSLIFAIWARNDLKKAQTRTTGIISRNLPRKIPSINPPPPPNSGPDRPHELKQTFDLHPPDSPNPGPAMTSDYWSDVEDLLNFNIDGGKSEHRLGQKTRKRVSSIFKPRSRANRPPRMEDDKIQRKRYPGKSPLSNSFDDESLLLRNFPHLRNEALPESRKSLPATHDIDHERTMYHTTDTSASEGVLADIDSENNLQFWRDSTRSDDQMKISAKEMAIRAQVIMDLLNKGFICLSDFEELEFLKKNTSKLILLLSNGRIEVVTFIQVLPNRKIQFSKDNENTVYLEKDSSLYTEMPFGIGSRRTPKEDKTLRLELQHIREKVASGLYVCGFKPLQQVEFSILAPGSELVYVNRDAFVLNVTIYDIDWAAKTIYARYSNGAIILRPSNFLFISPSTSFADCKNRKSSIGILEEPLFRDDVSKSTLRDMQLEEDAPKQNQSSEYGDTFQPQNLLAQQESKLSQFVRTHYASSPFSQVSSSDNKTTHENDLDHTSRDDNTFDTVYRFDDEDVKRGPRYGSDFDAAQSSEPSKMYHENSNNALSIATSFVESFADEDEGDTSEDDDDV